MRIYFRYIAYLVLMIGHSVAMSDAYVNYFRAVNVDNASTVSALLAQGFDPNTPSESGQVGLYLAIRDDSPKVAAVLLARARLKIDAKNAVGETPLMMAALRGNLEWVKKLADRGAIVQLDGWSPLHYAATGPNPQVLAWLIERGAKIDASAPNGNTPLMMAARYGPDDSVRLLLRMGADKKLLSRNNQSAVDLAKAGDRPWLLPLLQ